MRSAADLLIDRVEVAVAGGLKKATIARDAKMSASQLDGYLKRERVPGLDAAERLAVAIGSTLHELLTPRGPGKVAQEHDVAECYRRVGAAAGVTEEASPVRRELAGLLAALNDAKARELVPIVRGLIGESDLVRVEKSTKHSR